MGISVYKIKKWYRMLTGKSISHVVQGEGTCYSKTEVAGYYNDLTEKVTKDDPSILVPRYYVDTGEERYFSIGIFQYGLASYDLLLTKKEEIYKDKLVACAEWAVKNQQTDGGWATFDYENEQFPYSSMAQGEAVSMLLRANIVTGKNVYLEAAKKAKDFMLKPINEGGTTEYIGDDVVLYECTTIPTVLNGWIFSLWGLYDWVKYTNDCETKKVLDKTLLSLERKLSEFDVGYWSKYDLGNRICSPFYHKLHIAQLSVMYDLFERPVFLEYKNKWEKYQHSFWNPKKAFFKKALQKIFER